MSSPGIAFATLSHASFWKRWLLLSPVARIALFAAAMVILTFVAHAIFHPPGGGVTVANLLQRPWAQLGVRMLPAVLAYLALVWLVERRRPRELALRDIPTFGIAGLLGGSLLFSFIIGILWLFGSYHVTGTQSDTHWLAQVLVLGIAAGVGEEIVFRGVLFRIVEEGIGTWWALAISALVFGLLHIGNPGATVWTAVAIAIEAGILFGLVYHLTRSLWACIGLHVAWNVIQGTVYGISVSGIHTEGFLVSTRTGPSWLSGGTFGVEASVVSLISCCVLSAILLVVAIHRGSIVPPCWRRKV